MSLAFCNFSFNLGFASEIMGTQCLLVNSFFFLVLIWCIESHSCKWGYLKLGALLLSCKMIEELWLNICQIDIFRFLIVYMWDRLDSVVHDLSVFKKSSFFCKNVRMMLEFDMISRNCNWAGERRSSSFLDLNSSWLIKDYVLFRTKGNASCELPTHHRRRRVFT